MLDDGVVGDDSHVRTKLTPPQPRAITQEPLKQPISTEEAELALQLQRTSANIDALRHSVRKLKGLSPTHESSSTDVSADCCTDANTLIQRCLDDGYGLVTMLRSANSKSPGGSGRRSVLVALAFAVFTVVVAVLVVSPQLAREVRRIFYMVLVGTQGIADRVWEKGWRKVLESIWEGAVEVGEKVNERICETIRWPDWFEGKDGEGPGERIRRAVGGLAERFLG